MVLGAGEVPPALVPASSPPLRVQTTHSGTSSTKYSKNVANPIPKKCSALSLMGSSGRRAKPSTPRRMSHAAVKKTIS